MSQSGVYSELKPAWWYAKEGKLPDAPKQVQLVLSDLCNQDCSFCAYRMSGYTSNELFMGSSDKSAYGTNNPKRMIPTERAMKLLEEFAELGVLAVQFTGGGEPTVHKHHEDLFHRCLELGMKASLVSNGLRWSRRLKEEILPLFSWVRVSIDAGNKEAYAKVRRTSELNWDQVWGNVSDLSEAVDKRESSNTLIGLGFVVTPDTWDQIGDFAKVAEVSGADNIRISAMFSPEDEGPFVKDYDKIVELIESTRKRYESPRFKIHDNFGSRFSDLKQHAPDYDFCSYQFYTAYVGGDMQTYRCCVLAYNKRGQMEGGDLSERSFVDFWRSKERVKDMNALDARGCERCQFNSKNRSMNYLMQIEPPHKEFT